MPYTDVSDDPMFIPLASPGSQWLHYGTRVRKISGSDWHGFVVGYYRSSRTSQGYCVESERERGSVQLYPASALERVTDSTKGR